MARPDNTPRAALRPIDALTPAERDLLTDESRAELADLGGTLQRRHRARTRIGLEGGAACPPYLEPTEAEAPGAARLYVSLDGETFTAERAVEVGSYLEMDRAAVAVALEALRRAELVVDGPAGMVTTPPGNVPF